MKLTFWGAARQVTGSMYVLEVDDYKILIDCGSNLEKRKLDEEPEKISPYGIFPFEPTEINLVILTHAHIDHSGMLPNLIKEGYEGQILCTSGTFQLSQLLLNDAAALNMRKLKRIEGGGGGKKKKVPANIKININELYTEKTVDKTINRFVTIGFNDRFKINKNISVIFNPTGHLLGAANVIFEINDFGTKKTICFSGDIGRKNYPLLTDPMQVPEVDYIVCETTYGNRRHKTKISHEDALASVIQKTCIDAPGRLIIPAFSVGRSQALLFTLNKLYTERNFPKIRVFADSPLAYKSTKVYESFIGILNQEAKDFFNENQGLFDFENLVYVEDLKQSKMIKNYMEPCIIVSSSGMVQGGRVEQHIFDNISNPYCTILMIGYASEGTLGHELLNGMKVLKTKSGKEMSVEATIESIDIFSGHGDLDDLTSFVKWQDKTKLKNIFLTHGEYSSMLDFKAHLNNEGYMDVEIPEKGQAYLL